MLPVGLLMKEHRIIEKMIALIKKKLTYIKKTQKADIGFIDTAVDFMKVYADKCHHGKEEDILFRELKKKPISREHGRIMEELINEHIYGRKTVAALVKARGKYEFGNKNSRKDIEENMSKLVDLYPKHIDKEDNHFFLPVMEYFSDEEKESMFNECKEFDMDMIHKKYKGVVESFKKERKE
jgi:hemerythrin-like domain-containing protein